MASAVPLYAGFWRRGAAAFLDGMILLVPSLLVGSLSDALARFAVSIILGCAYFAGFHSSAWQATPGKKAFGIKVTDLEGRRIGLPRAIGRHFATALSFITIGIGFAMAGFTKKRQALHDMVCGTLVVSRGAEHEQVAAGGGTMPLTAAVWVIAVLPFLAGIAAGIAVPAYRDYGVRAQVNEVMRATRPLMDDVARAMVEKREWPVGAVPIDSAHASAASVTPQGEIVVALRDQIAPGGRVRFTPSVAAGSVQWKCRGENTPAKFLPASCRE